MRNVLKLGALTALATLATSATIRAAHAEETIEALTIAVDVEEHRGREVIARASYVLPFAGDRNGSKLSESRDGVQYTIEVGREGLDGGAPVVGISLSRKATENRQVVEQSMRSAVRLTKGGRVLAGHFERDHSATDVYVSRR